MKPAAQPIEDADLLYTGIQALPPTTILSVEAPLAGQADPADPVALAVAMLASARRAAGESGE